jgi:hypothetical protein
MRNRLDTLRLSNGLPDLAQRRCRSHHPDLCATITDYPAGGDSGATAEASNPPSPEGLAQLELESCAGQTLSECRLDEFGKRFPPRAQRGDADPLQSPRNES